MDSMHESAARIGSSLIANGWPKDAAAAKAKKAEVESAQAAAAEERKRKAIGKLARELCYQVLCRDEKRWERIKETLAKINGLVQ